MAAHLAFENSRARVRVRSEDGVVDVDEDTRVSSLVRARECHEVRAGWLRAAAARDGNLTARQVELGASRALGDVQGDLLAAHEIVAWGNAGRDGNVNGGLACNNRV